VAKKRRTLVDDVIDVPPPRPQWVRQRNSGLLPLSALLPGPVTWVFAGGGAHGAVQLGLLQSVSHTDVSPAQILGTSAGALTGAIYAEDPVAGPSRLSYVWADLGIADVVSDGWWGLLKPTALTKVSLADSSGERESLESILQARTFDELALPMGAVATDVDSGEPVILDSGELIPALMASSAIPGVLPPVAIHGRWFMDGLASANLPASIAARRGAGSIIAFDTSPAGNREVSSALQHVVPAVNALLANQQRVSSLSAAAQLVPVIYLPTPGGLGGALSFKDSLSVARQAYEIAQQFLLDLVSQYDGELDAGLYARADGFPANSPLLGDVLKPVKATDSEAT
jgi:NTE family protein